METKSLNGFDELESVANSYIYFTVRGLLITVGVRQFSIPLGHRYNVAVLSISWLKFILTMPLINCLNYGHLNRFCINQYPSRRGSGQPSDKLKVVAD